MNKTQYELCKELSDIIMNYRKDELNCNLNGEHVHKWVSQFSEENIDVILSETIHIFQKWYFPLERIKEEFLDEIIIYLQKKYNYDHLNDLITNTCFLNVQDVGESQKKLLQLLNELLEEQYRLSIHVGENCKYMHYVYIDDGLYTGSRARKDIRKVIEFLPKNSTVDVFYIVAGTNAFYYTVDQLKEIAKGHRIDLSLNYAFPLYNRQRIITKCEDGTEITEYIDGTQICLWPDRNLENNEQVKKYEQSLELGCKLNHLYRNDYWRRDKGIFTSINNRNIIEKEFLIKGIEILDGISDSKGMYPLGYNLWKSFGFGSFCATDLNISNTCPLVLWWDIGWTPLLPRRTNSEEKSEIIEFNEDTFKIDDQYNMCPDCGEFFGIETDGGNGFCVNCAWKH